MRDESTVCKGLFVETIRYLVRTRMLLSNDMVYSSCQLKNLLNADSSIRTELDLPLVTHCMDQLDFGGEVLIAVRREVLIPLRREVPIALVAGDPLCRSARIW